jgi:hypothetical protein
MEEWMYISAIFNLGTRGRREVKFMPRQLYLRGKNPWNSEPVRTLWSKEISLAPAGNHIPAVQPVAYHYTD